jgi:uncharacterized protein involved in exopolysaccharide biosynthesis
MTHQDPSDSARELQVPVRGSTPATTTVVLPARRAPARPAEGAIALQLLLRAVTQWWKVILPVSVLSFMVVGFIIWRAFDPIYRASARIQIEPR